MLKARYDEKWNAVIIDFEGEVHYSDAEKFYAGIENILPKHGKGFRLLTDFTHLKQMDVSVQELIKKAMDLFNEKGVTQIIRVVPTPDQDIGFNILSAFHYSKSVKFLILASRAEAEERFCGNE